MKKLFLSLLTILAVSSFLRADDPFKDSDKNYSKYIELADEAAQKKDWTRAEELLRAAIQLEPSNHVNVMLLSNIGMYQFYRGEDEAALQTLTDARGIAPASTVVLRNRARVLTALGRKEDAIKDLDLIIEKDSANFNAYYDRGQLRYETGDTVGARSDFQTLEQLRPGDPQMLLIMAVMNSNQGNYDDAISYYNQLLKLVQKPEYYCGRAMARLAKQDLAEASDDIARGLELDPEDGELYFCRAYLRRLQYQDADARADAELARRYGVSEERITELFSE